MIGGEEAPWPTTKLIPPPAGSEALPCVLITTGAMNPIHAGHVAMLHAAAARVEEAGFHVCALYLSPTHDGYVQPKAQNLNTIGLSAGFRLVVARCAVASDPRVAVASWEANHPGHWPDFPVVCGALQSWLQSDAATASLGASVFYVCGTDHASKCGLWRGMGEFGVVVVPRAGDKPPGTEKPSKHIFVAQPAAGNVASFSSTKLRAALSARDEGAIAAMVSTKAGRLLLRPTPDEYATFASDYKKLRVPPPAAPASAPHSALSLGGLIGSAVEHAEQEKAAVAEPRTVFISLSALLRKPWSALSADPRLPEALFFFGSKRSWIFPSTEAERRESEANNPAYMRMPLQLRECILAKESKDRVFWLKPDWFVYDGGLYSGDPSAYPRASEWLQTLHDPVTAAPYRPLKLDPDWWRAGTTGSGFDKSCARYSTKADDVVRNFQNGAHDYMPVCELLSQSNPTLVPAFD